jgi:alkanesulfonate monooxygenase SsuD/methylene tetrahydromethanopterin reductase-like flavin-dependent oxidoreductase (luciferase family)
LDLGAHLPILDMRGEGFPPRRIVDCAEAATDLGFAALSANDHMLFSRPWLDGPAALASVVEHSGELPLATTTMLSVVRGPAPTAKTLAALDLLSGGRLEPSLGPGSSRRDYEAAKVPFEERWARYDESLRWVRAALDGEPIRGSSRFYPPPAPLEPRPSRHLPLWVASWGSPAGLRRVARHGDGWMASAYNTDAEAFARARESLAAELASEGREAAGFPAALASMWTWVARDAGDAERTLTEVLAPLVGRPADELRDRVCVGSPEEIAAKLRRYAEAGCDRLFIWPLGDEIAQLELVAREVVPALGA